MLWYTCLIKHAETLLRTKDCCTHSLLHEQQDALTQYKDSIEYIGMISKNGEEAWRMCWEQLCEFCTLYHTRDTKYNVFNMAAVSSAPFCMRAKTLRSINTQVPCRQCLMSITYTCGPCAWRTKRMEFDWNMRRNLYVWYLHRQRKLLAKIFKFAVTNKWHSESECGYAVKTLYCAYMKSARRTH
jgi:hypothetical protein